MRLKLLWLLSICFLVLKSEAQTAYKNREYSFANDNDVYLLAGDDQYYTNGLIFHKRWVPGGEAAKKDTIKRIFDFEFSNKIFTPQDLVLRNPDRFDRPYAGLLTFGLSHQKFISPSFSRTIGTEVALTGRISLAQAFQEWHHKNLGMTDPRGWGFQIPNEVLFNIKAGVAKQFWLKQNTIDVVLD